MLVALNEPMQIVQRQCLGALADVGAGAGLGGFRQRTINDGNIVVPHDRSLLPLKIDQGDVVVRDRELLVADGIGQVALGIEQQVGRFAAGLVFEETQPHLLGGRLAAGALNLDEFMRLKQIAVAARQRRIEVALRFLQESDALRQLQLGLAHARVFGPVAQDHVQTLLQYTKIRAPYDGIVTQRKVNTRDFVQPGAGNKGAYLFVVEKINPVRVFINVQEMDAVWIRKGDVGIIRVQSLQGREFRGTVVRTARSLNPQNRTLRTEIDLPNPKGDLLPGTYVTATIIAEHKSVWTLPEAAVVTKGEEKSCYRVKNGRAVRTPLQIGMTGGGLVEVLKIQTKTKGQGKKGKWGAVTGKEEIIASDAAGLSDGQAVRPRR